MSDQPIRVIQYGLGPIGAEAARRVLTASPYPLQLVGAIDNDPEKTGRDVSDLLGYDEPSGVRITGDPQVVFAETSADVVLHATSSSLEEVYEQLTNCLRRNLHVVSTTEELLYPYARHPERSTELDQLARQHERVLIGTGVNPGFVMDTLALTATGVCTDVRSIRVERVVNAAERRKPLQQKVGAGLSPEAFERLQADGAIGHVGLVESLLFLADGLDWELDRYEESLDFITSEDEVKTDHIHVRPGEVAGIHHVARGYLAGEELITLDLKMYAGAEEPRDRVQITGDPPIDLFVRNGIFGDTATVGALVNTIPLVLDAHPGLQTMKDLPVPRAYASQHSRAILSGR